MPRKIHWLGLRIPFVLMAYRTKVNSSTEFSPFGLVFSREINQLSDWTSTPDADGSASVIAKAEELQKPIALRNINQSQVRQRAQQNKSMNVEEDLLPIGTKIFVRIEALGDKL